MLAPSDPYDTLNRMSKLKMRTSKYEETKEVPSFEASYMPKHVSHRIDACRPAACSDARSNCTPGRVLLKFGPGGGVQSRSPDSIVSVDDGDDGLLWEDAESSTGEKEKKKRRLLKANIFDQATQKCQ